MVKDILNWFMFPIVKFLQLLSLTKTMQKKVITLFIKKLVMTGTIFLVEMIFMEIIFLLTALNNQKLSTNPQLKVNLLTVNGTLLQFPKWKILKTLKLQDLTVIAQCLKANKKCICQKNMVGTLFVFREKQTEILKSTIPNQPTLLQKVLFT